MRSCKMTKMHFNAIAHTLLISKPKAGFTTVAYAQWEMIVKNMADLCATTNPAFNRTRFLDAAGMET